MKVLLTFEKDCNRIFDISDDKKKAKNYLSLFNERDKDGFYSDLREMKSEYYLKAKTGDAKAAERIISFRSRDGYEYERVEIVEVQ